VLTCFQVKKADRQSLREVRRRRALFASQSSSDEISIASMDDSKFSPALVFFVGNYFVTFFIIGLIAAGISLLDKPKPLRIGEVSEAFLSYHLLFAIGINNLINFVFHVFLGDSREVYRLGKQPVPSRGGIRKSGRGNCRSPCVQSKPAVSLCDIDSTVVFLIGRSRRSPLSDDRRAQFFARKRGAGSSN
jgi:hypothetical protein